MAGPTNTIKNYIESENSTFYHHPKDSKRLWTIPLVDTLEPVGRDDLVVVGFAKFFIEDAYRDGATTELRGRFIEFVGGAEIDLTLEDTGVYGMKLTK